MFMRQKRNETARLIWIKVKLLRSTSSLEQNALQSHARTKQSGEIQCEALEFSNEHTSLWFKLVYVWF